MGYLLKIWLQGGKKEHKYRQAYDKAINGVLDQLVHMSRPNYLTYVVELKGGRVIHKMDHLACFLGGNLALGAYTHPDGLNSRDAQRQLKTGKQLAYTCYQMEWAWDIFQAIEEHCKTDVGYASIQDVDNMRKENRMESFFLAETIKYLYLIQ